MAEKLEARETFPAAIGGGGSLRLQLGVCQDSTSELGHLLTVANLIFVPEGSQTVPSWRTD